MLPDTAPFLSLIGETARHWGLDPVSVKLASHSENLVYRVETLAQGDFAVRLHRPGYHTLTELESEQQWTAALNDAGLAVPVGETGPDGRYYEQVVLPTGESRFAGVVGWLAGEPLTRILQAKPDARQVSSHYLSIGQLTARLHNQAERWQAPRHFQRHALDAQGLMGETPFWGPFWDLPEYDRETRELMTGARKKLYEALSCLDKSPTHYSMIHADLHASNLLVDGDSITVIDFDDAGFGWHIYDMAVTLFATGEHEQSREIFDAYVTGYRMERSLPDAELERYPLFRLTRGLASLGWAHHRREVNRDEAIAHTLAIVRPLIRALL